ncbi:MAG: hemolysin III family protein [Reyranella sp.]|nr:hemolysin III family protein [Reyranella sp.]
MTPEQAADRIVHALGIGLGAIGAIVLALVTAIDGGPGELGPVLIYAAGLLAMLGCSAAYNVFHTSGRREWLRRFDHAAIFAMIAGTYTPFTVRLANGWAASLTAVVWAVATAGIALKLWQPRRIEAISVVLYLALGWIGLAAVGPFASALDGRTLGLLALGGIVYTAGVVFHLWQRLPYQNAIWHGFVLVAAAVHYVAVIGLIVDT